MSDNKSMEWSIRGETEDAAVTWAQATNRPKKTKERVTASHIAYAKNPHALHSIDAYRFFLFFFSSCEQKENKPGNLFLKKNQTQFKET